MEKIFFCLIDNNKKSIKKFYRLSFNFKRFTELNIKDRYCFAFTSLNIKMIKKCYKNKAMQVNKPVYKLCNPCKFRVFFFFFYK